MNLKRLNDMAVLRENAIKGRKNKEIATYSNMFINDQGLLWSLATDNDVTIIDVVETVEMMKETDVRYSRLFDKYVENEAPGIHYDNWEFYLSNDRNYCYNAEKGLFSTKYIDNIDIYDDDADTVDDKIDNFLNSYSLDTIEKEYELSSILINGINNIVKGFNDFLDENFPEGEPVTDSRRVKDSEYSLDWDIPGDQTANENVNIQKINEWYNTFTPEEKEDYESLYDFMEDIGYSEEIRLSEIKNKKDIDTVQRIVSSYKRFKNVPLDDIALVIALPGKGYDVSYKGDDFLKILFAKVYRGTMPSSLENSTLISPSDAAEIVDMFAYSGGMLRYNSGVDLFAEDVDVRKSVSDSRKISDADVLGDIYMHCEKFNGDKEMITEYLNTQYYKYGMITYPEYEMICEDYDIKPHKRGY